MGSGPVVKETFRGGSSWSSAYVFETRGGRRVFVKTALGRDDAMFRGEALGLNAMRGEAPAIGRAGLAPPPWRASAAR